jgi:thymidine phosphorylase
VRFIGKAGEAAKVKALVNMVMNIGTAGLAEGLGPGAAIDFAVGLSNIKKVDERIERGDPLLLIHARNDATIRSVLPLLKSDRGCLKAPECFCDPPDPIKPHHVGY